MGNRTAIFLSTLIASIVAGAPLAAVSQNAPAPSAANAAGECLASPKGTAPQGQHWFYRIEHPGKRQCWYLRAASGKATSKVATSAPDASSAAQPDAPSPPSVQNAHAEYVAAQNSATQMAQAGPPAATVTPAPPAAVNSAAQQPTLATQWPDPAASAAPAPQDAQGAADTTPSAQPAATPAPVALAAADASAEKSTASLQMLLLVVGGALALAGLIASVIYRFARLRSQAREQRRVNWDRWEPLDRDGAPWRATPAAAASQPQRPHPVDFDAPPVQSAHLAAFASAIGAIVTRGPSPQIDTVDTETAEAETAAPDEARLELHEGFEIETPAPQLAADHAGEEQPAEHPGADEVDIDVITAMLERMAKEGPRLAEPSPEADLADFGRSQRAQSAARA